MPIENPALDPQALKASDLCRLLNSTPLGAVTTEAALRKDRLAAGFRIGDGKTTDLVRYAAWLAERRHAPPAASPSPASDAAGLSERDRQRLLMRRKRAAEHDIVIPAIVDRRRRARCEHDCLLWLSTYMPHIFSGRWTETRRDMVAAILTTATHGGDQAIAAPRGDGKSKIALGVSMFCIAQGLVRFALICAATGPMAGDLLEDIKEECEVNDLLLADYPEICAPIRALAGANQRANSQTAGGVRTRIKWSEKSTVFPTVPPEALSTWTARDLEQFAPRGSRASGAVIRTRGLDSAIRGIVKGALRPDLVIIDDPETAESAKSADQTRDRMRVIENDIGGLAEGGKTLARVMLTTIQNRAPCLSHVYTDPAQKPSWNGRRYRFVVAWPEREDLWEEYLSLRADDQQRGDRFYRRAHAFYLEHRAAMDQGAVVSNPDRYDGKVVPAPAAASDPDARRLEVSALQSAYNLIGDRGLEYFYCELQNDPPEEDGPVESGITPRRIQLRLSGYPVRVVPPDVVCLSQGIDIKKKGGHWVVRAWRADATNFTIEYGFSETHGTVYASDDGVEVAIRNMILDRMDVVKSNPYRTVDGRALEIGMTLIDARYQKRAVYQACLEVGLGIRPAMGHGRSHGCATPNFHDVWKRTRDRKPGDGFFEQRQADGVWLVHCDTDRWKSFEHARWLTGDGKPGAAYLFGDMTDEERRYLDQRLPREAKEHQAYAAHLTSEIEVEDSIRGRAVRRWKEKAGRVNNHYFDASYLADVAAAMQGVRLFTAPAVSRPDPAHRPTPAQLAQPRRRAEA